MCSTWPSLPNIGNPAARTAAVTSTGAGHGGGLSAPTATVAGALFEAAREVCGSCFPVGFITATITTASAAVTTTAPAIHSHFIRRAKS